MWRVAVPTALLLGCSFDPGGLLGTGDPIDGSMADHDGAAPDDGPPLDGPPQPGDDVHHVPAGEEAGGTGALALDDGDLIDTATMQIAGASLPDGVVFETAPQDGGGPELAILRVDTLSVTGTVRAFGTRPLVVIATSSISIAGGAVLDGGARRQVPGPGGAGPGLGNAPGQPGGHSGTYSDSGGGGGGHGTAGGAGGDAVCGFQCEDVAGGAGGGEVGDAAITTLDGGSGGGAPAPVDDCAIPAAGAGGGAIQLYAGVVIQLAGAINAGGGGGGGGDHCDDVNWSAASGGGSGGAIYLQAPTITAAGGLYANGGGGGGSAGASGNGSPGSEGGVGTSTAFGAGGGTWGEDGAGGDAPDDGNGGGGGGAAGRIAVRVKNPVSGTLTSSPAADVDTY